MNIWSKTKRSWISLLHHSYLLTRKNKYISNNEKNFICGLWKNAFLKIFHLKNFGFFVTTDGFKNWRPCKLHIISTVKKFKANKSILLQHKKHTTNLPTFYWDVLILRKTPPFLKTRFLFQWLWLLILFVSSRIPHVRLFFYFFRSSRNEHVEKEKIFFLLKTIQ